MNKKKKETPKPLKPFYLLLAAYRSRTGLPSPARSPSPARLPSPDRDQPKGRRDPMTYQKGPNQSHKRHCKHIDNVGIFCCYSHMAFAQFAVAGPRWLAGTNTRRTRCRRSPPSAAATHLQLPPPLFPAHQLPSSPDSVDGISPDNWPELTSHPKQALSNWFNFNVKLYFCF